MQDLDVGISPMLNATTIASSSFAQSAKNIYIFFLWGTEISLLREIEVQQGKGTTKGNPA